MRLLINIDVPELAPAIDFYCAALSLHCSRIIDEDVAELTGASSTLYLLRQATGAQPATNIAGRHYTRHWTPVHIDFVVSDIDEAAKRAISAGARQESTCVKWMGSICITFSDPFGHGFCLIEFDDTTYTESKI